MAFYSARHNAESSLCPRVPNGGLAQLGERLAGSQKVSGSSPLSSTTFSDLKLSLRATGFSEIYCLAERPSAVSLRGTRFHQESGILFAIGLVASFTRKQP